MHGHTINTLMNLYQSVRMLFTLLPMKKLNTYPPLFMLGYFMKLYLLRHYGVSQLFF